MVEKPLVTHASREGGSLCGYGGQGTIIADRPSWATCMRCRHKLGIPSSIACAVVHDPQPQLQGFQVALGVRPSFQRAQRGWQRILQERFTLVSHGPLSAGGMAVWLQGVYQECLRYHVLLVVYDSHAPEQRYHVGVLRRRAPTYVTHADPLEGLPGLGKGSLVARPPTQWDRLIQGIEI